MKDLFTFIIKVAAIAAAVIAVVLVFKNQNKDFEELKLIEEAKRGNMAAKELLESRRAYKDSAFDKSAATLDADSLQTLISALKDRARMRRFEEKFLHRDGILYDYDGTNVRPIQELKAGHLVRVFWMNVPIMPPGFSENLTYVAILDSKGNEVYGHVRESIIGSQSPSQSATWWDLPKTGDVILHKGVQLKPGQTSENFSFTVEGSAKYELFVSKPDSVIRVWINGQEVRVEPRVRPNWPHLDQFVSVKVQLSEFESEPSEVRFVVSK